MFVLNALLSGAKSHAISFKSFKNLLTVHAEDMKLFVDAILRRSH